MMKGAMMKHATILLAAAMVLGGVGAVFADTAVMNPLRTDGYANLTMMGGARYVFGGKDFTAFKPYVVTLYSPKGFNPLRDNVADHIHHHGLMFAIAVDGVDFWSETKNCGKQIHRETTAFGWHTNSNGRDGGVFAAKLDWVRRDGNTVAKEERTISADRDTSGDNPQTLTWRTQLSPPPGKDSITLTGSHYFGLGMRLVKSMDNASSFQFADPNAKSLTVRGDEKLTPSTWAACTGSVDGNTVTVAMFDHPDNPRPVLWFTMGKPFSYLSATINLWKEPMVIKAGEKLDVCYGVAVWDGKPSREQIEAAYRRWRGWAPSLKAAKKEDK